MKSKCCNAPVTVGGQTTQYYVCLDCEKATDPQEEVECSHLWYPHLINYDSEFSTGAIHATRVDTVFCQKCLKIVALNNPQ